MTPSINAQQPPQGDTVPTPTVRRNRAGSTSGVDLTPYRTLLSSLEDGDGETQLSGKEDEVRAALRMLLDHVDGLVSLHAHSERVAADDGRASSELTIPLGPRLLVAVSDG
jgi:hypothetical protein